LAGEEFGESWVPDSGVPMTDGQDRRVDEVGETTHDNAMTSAAADRLRERREQVRKAKTEEERKMIQKQGGTYRVAALFTDEESVVVRAVLGTSPAEAILRLCREEIARKKAGQAKSA
jgi:stalled ribosome alternative rescue factor ArfA